MMKSLAGTSQKYLEELEKRKKTSRVHRSYQFVGLEIAAILRDWERRSLYMKLAKEGNADRLLALAKSVAEKRDVKNRGAYFMRLVQHERATKYEKSSNIRKRH